MATGRNRIKATEIARYWITHHIAYKQLTYVQAVLMPMPKIPALNFERGPKCF
jgi:hypothetical protein